MHRRRRRIVHIAAAAATAVMLSATAAPDGLGQEPAAHAAAVTLPTSVAAGARVRITGSVGRLHGTRVALDVRNGARWRHVASIALRHRRHGRFALTWSVPTRAGRLAVRVVLLAGSAKPRVLAHRTVTVTAKKSKTTAPGTTTGQGRPVPSPSATVTPPTSHLPTGTPPSPSPSPPSPSYDAAPVRLRPGSTTPVVLPDAITRLTAVRHQAVSDLTATLGQDGRLVVAATTGAATGARTIELQVDGCVAAGGVCPQPFVLRIPVTILALAAAPGTLDELTIASPDRVAQADDHALRDEAFVDLGTVADPGTRADADAVASAVGAVVTGGLSDAGLYQLRWTTPQDMAARVAQLGALPGVTDAGPSNVDVGGEQSTYAPTVATAFDKSYWTWRYDQVHAAQAWTHTHGSDVTVGIIDAANVPLGLEDLDVVKWLNPIIVPAQHATHVAGLACAKAGNAGMVGLAWGCPLVSTYVDSWSDAGYYLAMNRMVHSAGVRVVNASLGWQSGCADYGGAEEIDKWVVHSRKFFRRLLEGPGSGILWTFSAGNNCISGPSSPFAANADLPNVLAVAATNGDTDDGHASLASFSNYDVEIAAPGGVVPQNPAINLNASCTVSFVQRQGHCGLLSTEWSGCPAGWCSEWGEEAGTSMASPVVAGIAALVMSAHPDLTAAEVGDCITDTAGTGGVGSTLPPDGQPGGSYAVPAIAYAGNPIPIVNADAAVQCDTGPGSGGGDGGDTGPDVLALAGQSCSAPAASGSGRFVAFVCADTSQLLQVYERDMTSNTTTLVSANLAGTGPGNCDAGTGTGFEDFAQQVAVSDDGRYVAFASCASDLTGNVIPAPTPGFGQPQIYRRDMQTGTTLLVSVAQDGTSPANCDAGGDGGYFQSSRRALAISADGQKIAFKSCATNLAGSPRGYDSTVYVRDVQAGTTALAGAIRASDCDGDFNGGLALSGDGRYLVFAGCQDLPPCPCTGNGNVYLYERDLQSGTTKMVTVTPSGEPRSLAEPTAYIGFADVTVSDDGRRVVFASTNSRLFTGNADEPTYPTRWLARDMDTFETRLAAPSEGSQYCGGEYMGAALDAAGRFLARETCGNNGQVQVSRTDLLTGSSELVSQRGGKEGNCASRQATISRDGGTVAFQSCATNLLVSGQTGVLVTLPTS
ncbi:MAG TPA: S8 family serine peptidase [Baekduia sp.]|nr:S8 family serine peptidase [Baekduia sp.]